jgi:hypothetical protein
MKHASFPTTIDSAIPVASPPLASPKVSTRLSLLQRLLASLHHSRRLQAQGVLAQYRHLIARPEKADAQSKVRDLQDDS